ncbi:hypothetical protein KR044_012566 [Drosophila immigrans]|nr:hypothetical protein KR044_012566 [Drosophila immigrans]
MKLTVTIMIFGFAAFAAASCSAPFPSYGIGVPSPRCPENYLFSCKPNLTPVPCSGPAAATSGPTGAYSVPLPSYANIPDHLRMLQYY